MKNKIIAVLTACCMICGAFSFDTVNTIDTADNNVSASAVGLVVVVRYVVIVVVVNCIVSCTQAISIIKSISSKETVTVPL